jgi:methyl-accepting chemotaxis protein
MGSISAKLLVRMLIVSLVGLAIAIIVIMTLNANLRTTTAQNLLNELQFLANSKLKDKEEATLGSLVGMSPSLFEALKARDQEAILSISRTLGQDFADKTPFKNIDLVAYDNQSRVLARSFANQPDPMIGQTALRNFDDLLNGKQLSTSGLALTEAGLYVSATVAVRENQTSGPVIGILDMRAGLRSIASELASRQIYYAMVLSDQGLSIWPNGSNNPKLDGRHLAHSSWFASSADWYKEVRLTDVIQSGFSIEGDKALSAYPVEYNGQVVGYQLVGVDMTYPDLAHAFSGVAQFIAVMVALFIIVLLALMVMLWFNVRTVITRPICHMQKLLEKASETGHLTANFSAQSNDEVGKMSQALNTLFKDVSDALEETNQTVTALAKGDFSKRIQGRYRGDLELMKVGINESADNITSVIQELSTLMEALRDGQFNKEIDVKGEGAYHELMTNAQSTLVTLKGVIFQINELMSEVARGYFTKRIHAKAKGELQILKDNINRTLDGLEEAIGQTANVMIAQGTGDLTKRIDLDLFGTLSILKEGVNNATSNVSSMMSQSNFSVLKLSDGTKRIAQGIQDLAGRTQSQAASLEQTAASMEEITSMIRQTADNAQEANHLSETSRQKAQEANKVVENTIKAIQEINESSTKISEITALIDSIAFQTNLLALNAAVEAARAGDHGRGFAVVAGEVRSLAQKSAEAAKEIRSLIDDTVMKVKEGAEMASQSGKALNVINDSIDNVTQIVQEISKATKEQATGVEQVNTAVAAIDAATQQNAALVEETAQQTEEMRKNADQVIELSKTFTIDLEQIAFSTAMKTGIFNFAHARRTHRQWKGTVAAYVAGMDVAFNKEVAYDHTKCALGKWFYGPDGQQYYHLPEMKEVEKYHAELHATIKLIIEASEANDIETQEREMKRLDELSHIVINKLTEAENAVAQMGNPPKAEPKKTDAKVIAPKAESKATSKVEKPSNKSQSNDDEWSEF